MSGSKNKINKACQVATDNDVFDKLRFVNEIGSQVPSQVREEVRTHSIQDTGAIIHGEHYQCGNAHGR
jgi:hypothetical protein